MHAHLNSIWCKQCPCICGNVHAVVPHTYNQHCDWSSSYQPGLAWGWRPGYEFGNIAVWLQACTSHWYVSSWTLCSDCLSRLMLPISVRVSTCSFVMTPHNWCTCAMCVSSYCKCSRTDFKATTFMQACHVLRHVASVD